MKCKGYIVEDVTTGLELFSISDSLPVWLSEGWVFRTFQEAKGYIDLLCGAGYRCITRRLEGAE